MRFLTEKRILWTAILLYIVFFGVFTSFRHYNFQSQAWDMGIFDQLFWNTTHGQFMQSSIEELPNHFGIHMSPFLFLLVPGYALFPTPYFLLIIQTIAIGLGAWPLYLLSKKILEKGTFSILIALGYLLYPSLHWINIFDFHEIAFFIPLMLTAFYFMEVKSWKWAGVFLALAASTKEDAILIVLFTGIYLLIKKSVPLETARPIGPSGAQARARSLTGWLTKERKIGLGIILLSAFYFLLSTKIIMPAFGGGLLRLDRYASLGATETEIVKNILTNPLLILKTIISVEKVRYIFWLFAPLLFLPFASGRILMLIIPGFLENLLTQFSSQFQSFYQYDSVLIPGIFIAAIFGLKNLLIKWPKKERIIFWSLIATIFIGYFVRSPINPVF
ncbi:MAG: DUF2079 domain-containing protein, partial [bacterium]|nr:DUF2079 domain-containing protein [bacterium]